ncbi:nicotinamide mononucleotide permease [Verticillium alfalfae VaMs.102]|uniref:Nicotinamide mononucleotide permease n=1 Tax=Verticillium alfalfae (strain VaMs.102 / ATCC MYA-4576 / FGSC 10136) TaxID=526221 RepID=C9SD67_VERA1|nr:nicotinamide mononucleotide permease [Verticillium alfalfae VaMs.102]EEY17032.1 nicotinamide mononucleotide permease [Verticillium alfalfae VaMs.102]
MRQARRRPRRRSSKLVVHCVRSEESQGPQALVRAYGTDLNLRLARLNTFEEDLGINGSHHNTAVAVLKAGYMVARLPSKMLITRVYSCIYLSCCALVWSGVSATTATTKSFSSLIAVRLSSSKTGSAAKWSIFEGLRHLAAVCMATDRVSTAEEKQTVRNGLKLAVPDYRTWVFVVTNICMISSYGFNNFFHNIVTGFGISSRADSLLMAATPCIVGSIMSFVVAFSSNRH